MQQSIEIVSIVRKTIEKIMANFSCEYVSSILNLLTIFIINKINLFV